MLRGSAFVWLGHHSTRKHTYICALNNNTHVSIYIYTEHTPGYNLTLSLTMEILGEAALIGLTMAIYYYLSIFACNNQHTVTTNLHTKVVRYIVKDTYALAPHKFMSTIACAVFCTNTFSPLSNRISCHHQCEK